MLSIGTLAASTESKIVAAALGSTAGLESSENDVRDSLTGGDISTNDGGGRMRIQQAVRRNLDGDRNEAALVEWDVHID